ncbi:hypothetical protein CTE07_12910 [Chitinophaga terrae (ex Kim and Jung 2007)]|nr:hypothetical protein CTE07_12910 [Chitinophaga terrae (ex Kim and Jung 2007)]
MSLGNDSNVITTPAVAMAFILGLKIGHEHTVEVSVPLGESIVYKILQQHRQKIYFVSFS